MKKIDINENTSMNKALKIMTDKKLGTLIARNKKKVTTGIVTDGQVRKLSSKNIFLNLRADLMQHQDMQLREDGDIFLVLVWLGEFLRRTLCKAVHHGTI